MTCVIEYCDREYSPVKVRPMTVKIDRYTNSPVVANLRGRFDDNMAEIPICESHNEQMRFGMEFPLMMKRSA